jgi:hypothetical protein
MMARRWWSMPAIGFTSSGRRSLPRRARPIRRSRSSTLRLPTVARLRHGSVFRHRAFSRHPTLAVGGDGAIVAAWDEGANGTRRAAVGRATLDGAGPRDIHEKPRERRRGGRVPGCCIGGGRGDRGVDQRHRRGLDDQGRTRPLLLTVVRSLLYASFVNRKERRGQGARQPVAGDARQ